MPEGPKDKITVEPTVSVSRMDATREMVVDQNYVNNIIVEILYREYSSGSHQAFTIHRQFYKDGEITAEAKKLIIDAIKKHQNLVAITPEVIQNLPEIIIRYMAKLGYDINAVRQRILSLERRSREL